MRYRKHTGIAIVLLTVVWMLLLTSCGSAETKKSQGEPEWVYADVANDETACVVTKYNGSETSVKVPSDNEGKTVIGIGQGAFDGNDVMQTINLPGTITSIGEKAFRKCVALKSFHIGANVTSIGAGAFAGCSEIRTFTIDRANETYVVDNNCILEHSAKTLIATCKGSKMPAENEIEVIGAYAFAGNPLLSAVKTKATSKTVNAGGFVEALIPETVKKIGDGAFSDCPKLTSAVVPGFVTEVGDDLFSGSPVKEISVYKSGLKCLTKTETEGITLLGATEIEAKEFNNFTALKTLTLPETVTRITAGAFRGCGALESITIPFVGGYKNAAEGSEESAFGYIFGKEPYEGGVGVSQLRGTEDEKEAYSLFYIPKNLKKVTVFGGNIGYGAFYNCKSIETAEVNAQTVGEYAFTYCENLKDVRFSLALKEIGVQAFYQCKNLRKVDLLSEEDEDDEEKEEEETIDACVAMWCSVTFGNNYANPLSYGKNLYVNGTQIVDLVIPDGVTEIKGYAFYNCESLTTLTVPEGVTFIGDYAFTGCKGLKEINNDSTGVVITE